MGVGSGGRERKGRFEMYSEEEGWREGLKD